MGTVGVCCTGFGVDGLNGVKGAPLGPVVGVGIAAELVDERLTSWEAGQMVGQTRSSGRNSRRKRDAVDDVAAAILLRDYLEHTGRPSPDAVAEKD